jgi:RNA 3'-terminal phosphate cyclase (ATP)
MVEIDGSCGEGGGQILRSALSLALLTGQPLRLDGIRARRDTPGMRPQHLQAVRAAAAVSGARVEGAALGSRRLYFEPGPLEPGDYRFDIGTAGSTGLVLQTLYLPLAFAGGPSTLTITGGTHVPLSPCYHYLALHWNRFLEQAGLSLDLEMERAGFYPPGGGIVRARIAPAARILGLHLEHRGRLQGVEVLSAAANLPDHVVQRQMTRAVRRLSGLPIRSIRSEVFKAPSKGSLLWLRAEFECGAACFFSLGAPRKRAEQVADEAVDELLGFLAAGGAIDPYLADQLLLPLACARGESVLRTSRVTGHLITHAEVIRSFLPVSIEISGREDEEGLVRVRGGGCTAR